jgi:uncharacterized damage-inducible protein DinB
MQGLADALDAVLVQGKDLLESLNQESFAAASPLGNKSSIGAHYRHCIDHFRQLFSGLDSRIVDYDARTRESLLETDRIAAISATKDLLTAARDLRKLAGETPIEVRCGVTYGEEETGTASSTLDREVMFCISHTIHHYAIIAMLLRSVNHEVPEGFGVAPSTIRHRLKIVGAR